MSFRLKVGDLSPSLVIFCSDNGVGVDMTTRTNVQVVCHKQGDAADLWTRNASSVDSIGNVTYNWQSGDTDNAGRYLFTVKCLNGGKQEHFPPLSSLPVDVETVF